MGKTTTSYRIKDENGLYYLSFATVDWADVFTRKRYKDIVVESLVFCQKEKGLELYSWVLMSNHMHLVARASDGFELSGILRDFKRHTSKAIVESISTEPESRREWLLALFKEASKQKEQNFQFWRNDSHPIELHENYVVNQKVNNIHNNPVEAGIVEHVEDYLYISARDYADEKGLLDMEVT